MYFEIQDSVYLNTLNVNPGGSVKKFPSYLKE